MSDETQTKVSNVRPGQRIAKVMARAGVCSRREAEAWIAEGRVSVNGKALLSPAFNVTEADDVRVDGKPLGPAERTRLFLFHKPRGLVTTARDPEGRSTVFEALPPGLPRLVAVGRLDINTEGLLLLTNDGGLARVLELPSTGWLRRYRVRAHGSIDQAALDRLSEGVAIDGIDYQGVEARLDREQGANAWLTLGLREGKNREIKIILEHLGLAVNRLIRISFGPFELGDLAEGEVAEVRTRVLRDQLGMKLARQAGADFDAALIVRDEPPPGAKPAGARRRAGDPSAIRSRSERRERPIGTGRDATRAVEAVRPRAPAQACLGFARRNRRRSFRRQGSAQACRAQRDAGPQGTDRHGRAPLPRARRRASAPRPRAIRARPPARPIRIEDRAGQQGPRTCRRTASRRVQARRSAGRAAERRQV